MVEDKNFHERLRKKMDEYVLLVYEITKDFPSDERYGVISQLRKSALSVILNYIEGFARRKSKVHKNFLEISYGSLKESEYLLVFSEKQGYIIEGNRDDYKRALKLADDIGGMLWGTLEGMDSNQFNFF